MDWGRYEGGALDEFASHHQMAVGDGWFFPAADHLVNGGASQFFVRDADGAQLRDSGRWWDAVEPCDRNIIWDADAAGLQVRAQSVGLMVGGAYDAGHTAL